MKKYSPFLVFILLNILIGATFYWLGNLALFYILIMPLISGFIFKLVARYTPVQDVRNKTIIYWITLIYVLIGTLFWFTINHVRLSIV